MSSDQATKSFRAISQLYTKMNPEAKKMFDDWFMARRQAEIDAEEAVRREAAEAARAAKLATIDPETGMPFGWTYSEKTTAVLPPGRYWFGDLCYVLDETYRDVFGGQGYSEGHYCKGGQHFLVAGTAWGDGTYHDNEDNEYCVDAGILGIVSADLIEKDDSGGRFIESKTDVQCKFGGGRFRVDWDKWESISVDTH